MTYNESLIYLQKIEAQNYLPNLTNSLNLMTYLGNPQNTMPVVHVAGTNGKGSTIAFIKSMLIAGGYTVGTFTSPHILSPRELTHINDTLINQVDFAESIATIKSACDKMLVDGLNHPTLFECLTAASLIHLSKAPLDLAIIEVGMGGRFDSTNVFEKPLLTIITKVDYDHTTVLGHSLAEIAWHKGGIIKPDVPTIIAPNKFEVIEAISTIVSETGHKLYLMDEGFIHEKVLMTTGYSKLFHLRSNFFDYKGLRTSMLGRHQTMNLCTALLAIYQLRKILPLTEAQIREGILTTHWHCRNDLISKKPLIMIDGGHNPGAIDAIAALIEEHFPKHKILTVLGMLSDKNTDLMLSKVKAFSHQLILTEPLSPRAKACNTYKLTADVFKEPDYKEALKKALSLTDDQTLILVLGSFYLSCPAKQWFLTHLEANG